MPLRYLEEGAWVGGVGVLLLEHRREPRALGPVGLNHTHDGLIHLDDARVDAVADRLEHERRPHLCGPHLALALALHHPSERRERHELRRPEDQRLVTGIVTHSSVW